MSYDKSKSPYLAALGKDISPEKPEYKRGVAHELAKIYLQEKRRTTRSKMEVTAGQKGFNGDYTEFKSSKVYQVYGQTSKSKLFSTSATKVITKRTSIFSQDEQFQEGLEMGHQ